MSPKKATTPSQSHGTTKTQAKVSSTRSPSKTSSKSSSTTRKGHSVKATTQQSLTKNLKKLTTTTPKATKSTTKTTTKQIKVMNSRKLDMFPWVESFPYYLKDETEDKKCWFTCEEHATKYIGRYNCKYKLYLYTGKAG